MHGILVKNLISSEFLNANTRNMAEQTVKGTSIICVQYFERHTVFLHQGVANCAYHSILIKVVSSEILKRPTSKLPHYSQQFSFESRLRNPQLKLK